MTLFRSVTPAGDENLAGLVARAAGINIYPHAHDVLVPAGLGRFRPETMPIRSVDTAEALAEVLGTTPEALRPLYHPAIDERRIDFFGTSLRAFHRETRKRRLSPRALRDKAYIRAIWSVRPLSFDPDTRETLISHCPVCGNDLGFTKTWGIECCEHCVGPDEFGLPTSLVDLRDFPQPLVEVDDDEGLDYVVSLIDPRRSQSDLPLPHEDFSELDRGDLFELAVSLAGAIRANEMRLVVKPNNGWRLPVTDLTPDALARAGRTLLGWPRTFESLCKSASDRAVERKGGWGIYKEFGFLALMNKDKLLHNAARKALASGLDQALADLTPGKSVPRSTTRPRVYGEFVSVRQLIAATGVSSKITTRLGQHPGIRAYRSSADPRAPIAYQARAALPVLVRFRDLMSEAEVGATLGLPPDAVRDLCDRGFIQNAAGGYGNIAIDLAGGGTHYSEESVYNLVNALVEGTLFRKQPKGFVSFGEALLMFPTGHRPWQALIEAVIFDDDVVASVFRKSFAGQPRARNFFWFLSVKGIEHKREQILAEHAKRDRHDIGRVSAVAANLMLGIYNHHVFVDCSRQGLLAVDDSKTVAYQDVLEFAKRFIFVNEAAVRSRTHSKEVVNWLAARGVRPRYEFEHKGGVIFDREQVEPLLEMKA